MEEIIVNTRKKFIYLIKTNFIPYLISNGFKKNIEFYKSIGMFTSWTMYFYPNKSVELIK
jgi:hypothetical protein